jgi:hypothetical protein
MGTPGTAEEFRRRALRCIEVAKQTDALKIKELLLNQAAAWQALADEQERLEKRARERAAKDNAPE